ncbi:hypothetical protein G7Y79_00002g006560 [Physcia stellaris]|nr:hypothetical protein G7Y79_00002g006560 [Physcia stellaris]
MHALLCAIKSRYALAIAISLSLSFVYFILVPKRQRDIVADRLFSTLPFLHRGRRASSSKTPPRSISPEKNVPNNGPPPVELKNIFPPSQRDTLSKVAESYASPTKEKLLGGVIDDAEFRKSIIPLTADYRECGPSTYTPTGFSMEEVKALGDFPDYAELSGVPLPNPYKEFKIESAIARPYRPFRWAYHQTMSLTKLETDWWLELENNYAQRIRERKELYAKHGKLVLQYLPGSELACKEIMEMALQFLCARYPQYFSLTHDDSRGYIFQNGILKNETVINTMHPLLVLLENVPEDFACMLRNPEDGNYYFRAGLLCSALGWNVEMKIGLPLKEIHSPIPDYKEKMEFSMDRYFSKMPTSRPIQRGSWGLEVDTPIFMPPNDPHEDWQTLRRLPLSGSIIFNFKALFTPISEFRDEPYVPALLLKVLREGKAEIMRYKNTWHVEHVALPALERWSREQEERGVTERGWEVRTLEESPWFRGWEGKWRGRQGF